MKTLNWKRAEEIYTQLLGLSPERWTAELDALCMDEPAEFRALVEALLRTPPMGAEQPDSNRPFEAVLGGLATSILDRWSFTPGAQFANRYTLDAVIGAGGMGVVYRARDFSYARELLSLRPDGK